MLQSMTGYGSNSLKIDDLEINIELKTLNSRYFDSKISLPPCLSSQELHFNNILKDKLKRGKVDLKIKLTGSINNGTDIWVNPNKTKTDSKGRRWIAVIRNDKSGDHDYVLGKFSYNCQYCAGRECKPVEIQ